MIMHQPIENQDTVSLILKLANGETIIGIVEKETPTHIELRKPFRLVTIMTQEGNLSLTIMKWDITMDFNYPVRLFKTTIVACAKPNELMQKNYDGILLNGFDSSEDEEEKDTVSLDEEALDKIMKELKDSNTKIH